MEQETETQELRKVKTEDLKTAEPFKSLFSIDTETYKQTYSNVYVNMDLLGFDKTQPIIVWKGWNVVIDGHTRLKVAIQKELKEVWVIEKEFINEDDAIQYAIHLQRDRRKLTDADIFQLVCVLDKRHPPGRPRKTASIDAVSNLPPLDIPIWTYYAFGMAGIPEVEIDGKKVSEYCPEIPYPSDYPKTALNFAIHKRIPVKNQDSKVGGITVPGKGKGTLDFDGDLLEGLSKFSEWAYGRSDDITATLIGTSRAKVDKCRKIKDSKNEDIQDIQDKVIRGKLTINRACSILKNNGKRGNGKDHKKFKNNVVLNMNNGSIHSASVKWIILGTHGKPPKINQRIPKDSIICPEE
jgi:hypothetical protein